MKALRIESFGHTPHCNDLQLSAPAPHEVKVRVVAGSINPLDLKITAGYMQSVMPIELPYTLGTDFSGVVEKTGSAVTSIQVGDRVFGRLDPTAGGALAEYALVPAQDIAAMPSDMSFEQAAALPTAAGTAYHSLFELGHLKAGQRVLIHAGAGGVGSFAIQFAKQAGAYVATTGSENNLRLLKELGADEVINYRQEDFAAKLHNLDLVIDTIGGETLERSWQVVKPGGTVVSLVEFAIQPTSGIHGVFCFFNNEVFNTKAICNAFSEQDLQVVLDKIYPFADANTALEQLAGGHTRGKIIIRI